MITARAIASLAGLGLALSLSACSSSDSVADTNAAYCEGAQAVQTQFEQLTSLAEAGAPAEALKEQRDLVQSAIQANSVPLSQLQDSVKTEIEAANDAFEQAVAAIPDDATPAEAASSYKAAIDAYATSVDAVESELGCS